MTDRSITAEHIDALADALHGIKVTSHVLEDAVSELERPIGAEAWTVNAREGAKICHFVIEQAKAIERLERLFDSATGTLVG